MGTPYVRNHLHDKGSDMSDLKRFDVRYWYNGLIVVAVVIILAAMTAKNIPVLIIALGLLATGFGAWLNHLPMTYLYPKGSKYTVIEHHPTAVGWIVITCGVVIMLYGGYRLISANP
jgi:hypothetical protein